MEKPPFFVSATAVFAQVSDPALWERVGATTLDGAKRLATKKARTATFTAHVAQQDADGNFQTVAALDDSSAITRRRPVWKDYQLQAVNRLTRTQVVPKITMLGVGSHFDAAAALALDAKKAHVVTNPLIIRPRR